MALKRSSGFAGWQLSSIRPRILVLLSHLAVFNNGGCSLVIIARSQCNTHTCLSPYSPMHPTPTQVSHSLFSRDQVGESVGCESNGPWLAAASVSQSCHHPMSLVLACSCTSQSCHHPVSLVLLTATKHHMAFRILGITGAAQEGGSFQLERPDGRKVLYSPETWREEGPG